MQVLGEPAAFDDHDPSSTISFSIIPDLDLTSSSQPRPGPAESVEPEPGPVPLAVEELYRALTDCANLHPDVDEEEEEEDDDEAQIPASVLQNGGGINGEVGINASGNGLMDGSTTGVVDRPALPPPMPGSGGWITAENADRYFDEEGRFRFHGTLDEHGGDEAERGAASVGVGNVRPREEEGTDGDDNTTPEETKWRRTE